MVLASGLVRKLGAWIYSVQVKVLQRVAAGEAPLVKCYQKDGKSIGTPVDICEALAQYLERMHLEDVREWTDDPDRNRGGLTSVKKFIQVHTFRLCFQLSSSPQL